MCYHYVVIILILIALGLCAGSFVNALVWRLHKQSLSKNKTAREDYSIVKGRSMCPNCRHTLVWYDLLPIISWIMLKGRCRYCKKPVSAQYPIVELAVAFLFWASFAAWDKPFTAGTITDLGFWLVALIFLTALFVYDLKWMLLPNRLVYPLIAVSFANILVVALINTSLQSLVWPILGAITLSGLFYGLFQVSKGRWIGGGDVKLAIALGLLAGGVRLSVALLFIASLVGTLIALPLMATKGLKVQAKLPFGPLLIFGLIIVKLFGSDLISWYNQFFLIT